MQIKSGFFGSTWRFLALVSIAAMGLLALSASARAAGEPDISASVNSSQTLYGDLVHTTIAASNPSSEPYGYNLSFRVILPEGVIYAGGAPVGPQEIADQPAPGQTTLIFSNVSDLSPNSTREIGLELDYSRAIYDAGQSFPVVAQAFVNEDPRFLPKFSATGQPEGPKADSYTGYTEEVSGTQTLVPLEVEIEEPSPEGEILRGVHDHQTVYTLKVTNNGVNPTSGTVLDAYIPAGLEFLGCGGPGADNTTNAPTNPGSAEEYPGSGPIDVEPLAGCVEPLSVETEMVDPDGDGPEAEALYTHVVWPVGTLGDGETKTFPYRAAVPIRANTNAFSGTRPSAASGDQATNLDNNGGPEVVDETLLHTVATVSGTYEGSAPFTATDTDQLDRTAEDWVVHKSASSGVLAQGSITEWTLLFETGEYKFVEDAIVTDTVPSGLCPLGPANYTTINSPDDEECDPTGGEGPSAPYADVDENADGTFTVVWDSTSLPKLGHTGVSDKFTITFPTKTRVNYQQNFEATTPILTFDRVGNTVDTDGDGWARCLTPEAPDCASGGIAKVAFDGPDGRTIPDASGAEQQAGGPTISKQVAAAGTDCLAATYVNTVPRYHPGDRVCWRVRVDFPGAVDTSPQAIADFMPASVEYEVGSDKATTADNVIATVDESGAADGLLTWTVSGSVVPAGAQVFEHVFSTIARPPGTPASGDLTGNLLKFSSVNTPGESQPQRAEAEYAIDAPEVDLEKGVETIVRGGSPVEGPNGPNVDDKAVQADDEVTYRVDVTNDGFQDAVNMEVWDVLPAEYPCSAISEISDGGECVDASPTDRIVWDGIDVAEGGGTKKLTYTAAVPTDIGPGRNLVNEAGVRTFQGETNLGGFFDYTPASNIDPSLTESNALAADDPSNVRTAGAAVTKARATNVTEGGNTAAQATIGETISYTVTATIPEGTSLGGTAELTDLLAVPARQAYVAGSAAATLDGNPLPPGFTLNVEGAAPKVIFPSNYANPPGTGDDQLVLKFDVLVTDLAANVRGSNLANGAKLDWTDPDTGAKTQSSNNVSTTIVEPLISQAKSDDKNPSRVTPGEIVTYTLTTSNANSANVSTAHDVEIVDEVPAGLIPVGAAPGNEPLADGAEVPGSAGAIWDADTRTIAKTVATLAPNTNSAFSYRAEVEKPAVAGATLTNTVEATTASLGESFSGRRTAGTGYADSEQDTIRLAGASISKTATPDKATIGETVTYTLTVTIPANVELFDTTVFDLLPGSVEFAGFVSETCESGCTPATPIHRYPSGHTDETFLAWDLGDIPALSEPRVVKLVYRAYLRSANPFFPEFKVERGQTFDNRAELGSNLTDKREEFDPEDPPPSIGEFDEKVGPVKATVTVLEPQVSMTKEIKVGDGAFSAGPTAARSNDTLTYRIVATNSGDSPAYDVEVADQPDAALTEVDTDVELPVGVTVTDDWSAGDPDIGWHIDGPIAAEGGSVTLTYTAKFVAAAGLHDGQVVPNTAKVPHYFGVPKTFRDANPTRTYRDYEDGGEDSTQAVLDFPTFSLQKTTGLGGNPDTGDAEIGQAFPWRIVVANTSPTAGATDVEVGDTLPPNWSYVPGSTSFSTGGSPDPTVTPDPSGDGLAWTIPTLGPEESVTISFAAKPLLAAGINPGTGPEAHVNEAEVTGATDEGGNTGNEDGPYGTEPDEATATLEVPQLDVEKTPDGGSAVAGEGASFTVTVENEGTGVARDVSVTDVLPDGLSYTPGSATADPSGGFAETEVAAGPGAGETTVKWSIASIPAGGDVEITVPVSLDADLSDGATLVNEATVTSVDTPDPVEDEGSLEVGTEADVSIEKTGPANYTPGEKYTWQLRVQNLGPSDAQNVRVTDELPEGALFDTADSPCLEGFADVVSCSLGTLPPGFDQTYEVTVDIRPDVEADPLNNTAKVETDTEDNEPSNDESTHPSTPSTLADVWIEKTADPTAILRKTTTVFTIVVGNDGPSTAREVRLVDTLPQGLTLVSAVGTGCAEAGNTVECDFGDLAPGATQNVTVTARGVANGTHANTATVTTTTPEPQDHKPNEDSADVEVGPVADLAIEKTGPATVAADGELTWTLKATNNGEDPATEVEIVDTLPEGVVFVSASPDCVELDGVVTCEIGDLAVAESAEREITVTVPRALADATIVNSASVDGKEGDDVPENDEDEAETEVGPSADVSIVKTGPGRVTAGNAITWTLAVKNDGPSTATEVKVTDALPAGVTLSSATPSQGTCAPVGPAVECELGTLAKGASAQVEVSAQVPASHTGSLINKATVDAEEPDPDPSNDESSKTTTVDPPPPAPKPNDAPPTGFDLSISKKIDGSDKPTLGDVLRYEIVVANRGPAKATGIKVTDNLPSGVEFVSAALAGEKCSRDGSLVTCKLAELAAGAQARGTVAVRVLEAGPLENTAAVSAAGDTDPSNNRDSASTRVVLGPAKLTLSKVRVGKGAVEPGDRIRYRITVRNVGESAAVDVVVCDRLPASMSFAARKGAELVRGEACWTVETLPAGGKRTFGLLARLAGGFDGGGVRNVAYVKADNAPRSQGVAGVRVKSDGAGRGGGVTG